MQAYKKSNKLKIIGFCFGHQLIANYSKAKISKRERKGGLESVFFMKSLIEKFKYL